MGNAGPRVDSGLKVRDLGLYWIVQPPLSYYHCTKIPLADLIVRKEQKKVVALHCTFMGTIAMICSYWNGRREILV
jgi:hypothetical protein